MLGKQLDKEVEVVIVDTVAALITYDGECTTGLIRDGGVHKLGWGLPCETRWQYSSGYWEYGGRQSELLHLGEE